MTVGAREVLALTAFGVAWWLVFGIVFHGLSEPWIIASAFLAVAIAVALNYASRRDREDASE